MAPLKPSGESKATLAAIIGQPVTASRIGLLGGSFNPAHDGHLHISLEALKRLSLDQVWWLVSPQNPLKSDAEMAPFEKRFASAKAAARDSRIHVTDLESQLGTQYTIDTISTLMGMAGTVKFVWLMGADNLASFHKWRNWQDIAASLPFAVLARGGFSHAALNGKAAKALGPARMPAEEASDLCNRMPPAWVYLPIPLHPASATQIRGDGQWP